MKKKDKKKVQGTANYSQWKLIGMRFRRHKLALIAAIILSIFYLGAIFADFLVPYDPTEANPQIIYAPPTTVYFGDQDGLSLRPFIYKSVAERDPETLRMIYKEDRSERVYIDFFVEGYEYKLFGLFETNIHLFGVEDGSHINLFGTNGLGKDVFSSIIYGSRISLTIGLVGIALSLVLGVVIGGIAGYFGGKIDSIIQRLIDILRSIPTIPLWMGLSAAIPPNWDVTNTYLAITIILSLVGWTSMARVVRGKFLSLREEDFVVAARLSGVKEFSIIRKHLVPSFSSYIITQATLSIPGMILGETAMSFLGLGIRSPAVSWGVLLQDGQNVFALSNAPWILIPGIFVIITILLYNFVGDGLRDAADPYA